MTRDKARKANTRARAKKTGASYQATVNAERLQRRRRIDPSKKQRVRDHWLRQQTSTDPESMFEALRITDLESWKPSDTWEATWNSHQIQVPLGAEVTALDGTVVDPTQRFLDISDRRLDGLPSGFIQGTTGTGKTYMLLEWATLLAATYGPDRLNIALIDVPPGSGELLRRLPHFAGLSRPDWTTGLPEDVATERRAQQIATDLRSEAKRREHLLTHTGCDDIVEYHALKNPDSRDPLPYLLIIVDQLQPLLRDNPDLAAALTEVNRRRKELGFRLMMASQVFDIQHPTTATLWNDIDYAVSLRAHDQQSSQDLLGVPDAAHLPLASGRALLRRRAGSNPGTVAFTMFQDYAAIESIVSRIAEDSSGHPRARLVLAGVGHDTTKGRPSSSTRDRGRAKKADDRGPGLPDTERAEPVAPATLSAALGIGDVTTWEPDWNTGRCSRNLEVPLGVVDWASTDLPPQRRHELLDLSEGGLLQGVAGTGKTYMLRGWLTALTALYGPDRVNVAFIDRSPRGLASQFADVPHFAGLVDTSQSPTTAQVLNEAAGRIAEEIDRRAAALRDADVVDVDAYRRLQADSPERGLPDLPDLILVSDGQDLAESPKLQLTSAFQKALASAFRTRSVLGIHPIITSHHYDQVPTEVTEWSSPPKTRGFRVSLTTADPEPSVSFLGVPAAADLPRGSGQALLRTSRGDLIAFEMFAGLDEEIDPIITKITEAGAQRAAAIFG